MMVEAGLQKSMSKRINEQSRSNLGQTLNALILPYHLIATPCPTMRAGDPPGERDGRT